MRRLMLAALGAMMAAGCGTNDTGVIVHGVIIPSDSAEGCEYSPKADVHALSVILDTGAAYQLRVGLDVENKHDVAATTFSTGQRQTEFNAPNEFYPLRFELRWECDSPGFRSDLGPLVIPAFHPTEPFCLDRRSEVNQEFVGFDVIPASGGAIEAGEFGVVWIQPVPYQLGAAIDDTFEIARYADDCCRNSDNCDGTTAAFAGAVLDSCTRLAEIFNTLDPNGSELSVKANEPGTASQDLVCFRPFAVFNGTYWSKIERTHGAFSAAYTMRLRGVIEGNMGDGTLITSGETMVETQFCKGCGTLPPGQNQRQPVEYNRCYHAP